MIFSDQIEKSWQIIGNHTPQNLAMVRLELHHAAQLLAACGKYLLPEKTDDSHTSMEWLPQFQALASQPLDQLNLIRSGLDIKNFSLFVSKHDSNKIASFTLSGQTLPEALIWLQKELLGQNLRGNAVNLKMHFTIPDHPVFNGEKFNGNRDSAPEELSSLFSNTFQILNELSENFSTVTPVRCWPHHFDMAVLIYPDSPGNNEKKYSVGAGFSPGDDSYNQPYFYVSPWPYPDLNKITLPEISVGQWHTKNWLGAVLKLDQIAIQQKIHRQIKIVSTFLDEAISAATLLLPS